MPKDRARVFWLFPVFPGMKRHRTPGAFMDDMARTLQRAVATVQADHAYYAARYLLSFGYHAKGAPKPWTMFKKTIRAAGGRAQFAVDYLKPGELGPADMGDGWSLYYAINWRVGIGEADLSVGPGVRRYDEKRNKFAQYMPVSFALAISKLRSFAHTGRTGKVHVTNSVWYGDWLNSGGYHLEGTFLKVSVPNRFIEKCGAYLSNRSQMITDLALARLGLPLDYTRKHSPRFASLADAGGGWINHGGDIGWLTK